MSPNFYVPFFYTGLSYYTFLNILIILKTSEIRGPCAGCTVLRELLGVSVAGTY